LFVLAADLLQSIVNKAKSLSLLDLPLNTGYTSDFPIIQYANDTLLVMEAYPIQLITLKSILNTFAKSTSLKVNYAKSSLYPINISQERLPHLAATFHYKPGSPPFTYLGLPLRINRPSIQDCLPLTSRVDRRLISTSIVLTQGCKLQMVNSIISSLSSFYLCSIKVPLTILKHVDKYRRHYLWRGGDINNKKSPFAAWKMVTKPKSKGGIGVINLRLQNEVLLLKNLHKFYHRKDLPWVNLIWSTYYRDGKLPIKPNKGSFWWKSILKLLDIYKGIAHVTAGVGDIVLFWKDLWNGRILQQSYPQLYSFAINDDICLSSVLKQEPLQNMFQLPLSKEAFMQFCELDILLQPLRVEINNLDSWSYIWEITSTSLRRHTCT
jgi:hypothetical protein